ncbi:thioester-containing protein 1 allele S1-like [Bacillus rossius redtenbacheri]|uniref:thioester-containing protein 1 allele S1-like n=1 Tax=Bacillus rossius redtenbacheri TaxID=93214 RepID=UPI002FDE0948
MQQFCHFCILFLNSVVISVLTYGVLADSDVQGNYNNSPRYLVLAPRTVRPGALFGVAVTLLADHPPELRVAAEVSRDGDQVARGEKLFAPFLVDTIYLQIPWSSKGGRYRLKVEGGDVFAEETDLHFSPRSLAVVVQTSKPLYNSGQTVNFRVILLTTELTPYEDAVDVYVIDPDGFVMRRWVSMQLNSGVVSHRFALPELPKVGLWKIRVQAGEQLEEQRFKVENYFTPQFEVHVELPPYVLAEEEQVTAVVASRSELQRAVPGNATVTVSARRLADSGWTLVRTEHVSMRTGRHSLQLPVADLVRAAVPGWSGVELRVEASVTDYLHGGTATGFSLARVVSGAVRLRFLGASPQVFRPGAPFEGHVHVDHDDGEPLSEERLAGSSLEVRALARLQSGGSRELPLARGSPRDPGLPAAAAADDPVSLRYRREGLLYFRIDVPADASELLLTARYEDAGAAGAEGGSSPPEARLAAVRHSSPRGRYLSVRTSSPLPRPNEFAVFHVKANFRLSEFHYLVLSKGQLLHAGQQPVQDTLGTVTTLALPVARRMAPGFTLLVYHVAPGGELLADKVFLPVDGFQGYECYVEVNQGKDRTMRTAQAIMPADAGAFMGINAQRAAPYRAQAGNDVSKSRVADSFFKFENFSRPVARVTRRSRQGLKPDESVYLVTGNDALDARQTFALAGVAVFTDALLPESPSDGKCGRMEGYMSCFSGGCFSADQKCDGHQDCPDLSDEADCDGDEEDRYHYMLSRTSISSELYDAVSGEWGWTEMNGEYGGEEFLTMEIPPVGDDYFFTGFSVSKTLGFTAVDEPVQFSTVKPFMLHLEGPASCRRGEQLGLRALLLNNDAHEQLALVRLHGSPRHAFVSVGPGGAVASYGARLEPGEHQLVVHLPPWSQRQIDIPVAPTIEQGDLEITVSASTLVGHREAVHKLTVLPEGAHINKHTSVFLDLKNRAIVLRYLDIVVEESPIVPYQDWRRYVFGSPKGTITLSGDVIGPVLPAQRPTTAALLGREMKGTVAGVVELAAGVWTLHYLRLTNPLGRRLLGPALARGATAFGQVMRRYHPRGHFRNWDASQPSVWLTSWTIRTFKHASFPDWENNLYVEPRIFTQSVGWILEHQAEDGSFVETTAYEYPLDFKMYAKSGETANGTRQHANVPLTAHVLTTLNEVMNMVQGGLRTTAATAALKATRFLEKHLSSLSDPYEIAISAYALTMTESAEREYAFGRLQQAGREGADGQLYWSRLPIGGNAVKKENQRPFLEPREYQEGDSAAVEATAYALLVYLARDGVTAAAERMVDWLTSVRMTTSGFVSAVDTVVTLQALTEYAFRARIADITRMDVSVELPSSGSRETFHIGNESLLQLHSLQIPGVWGHANVAARGSGQAVVQMDVSYGVDRAGLVERPARGCFQLAVGEFYPPSRNKSAVTIESCFRWTRRQPPVSAAAVLEVQLPTGYGLLESEAVALVASGAHPTLRDARSVPGRTIWFFDHIPPDWTCFNHTVRRWFPVANMTQHRQALLYEAHAREHFEQVLVSSTPLYVLSICEVCGSYQCPYCPHYSTAVRPFPAAVLLGALGLVAVAALAPA